MYVSQLELRVTVNTDNIQYVMNNLPSNVVNNIFCSINRGTYSIFHMIQRVYYEEKLFLYIKSILVGKSCILYSYL